MSARAPVLSLRNVSKSFRSPAAGRTLKEAVVGTLTGRRLGLPPFWALRDIDLEVGRAECLGVIGGNGSGKSTLLRVAAGVFQPTSGEVSVDGRITSLIDLGAGLQGELTGRENIRLGGAVAGLRAAEVEGKMDAILGFAGLEPFADVPVRCYSSGMMMRLAFSLAMHARPTIMLVDDVLGVGDEAFRRRGLAKLQELRKDGATVVVVSHQLTELKRWCDRVAWLAFGRLAGVGEPADVIGRYVISLERPDAPPAEYLVRGASPVAISRIEFAGQGQHARLETGGSCALEIELEAREPVEGASVGVMLHREDGLCVYAVDSLREGVRLSGGSGTWRLRLELHELSLLAGAYHVNAAVRDGEGRQLDFRLAAATFEIVPGGSDSGVSRLPHRWVVEG